MPTVSGNDPPSSGSSTTVHSNSGNLHIVPFLHSTMRGPSSRPRRDRIAQVCPVRIGNLECLHVGPCDMCSAKRPESPLPKTGDKKLGNCSGTCSMVSRRHLDREARTSTAVTIVSRVVHWDVVFAVLADHGYIIVVFTHQYHWKAQGGGLLRPCRSISNTLPSFLGTISLEHFR